MIKLSITLTLDELERIHRQSLRTLISTAGNPTHLARMLGVPVSTVHGWSRRGRISKEGAKLVDQCPYLDFTFENLRPESTL